jgi:choline kinase
MKALILAAGRGTRLKEVGKMVPKCLLKINDETLLARQINYFKNIKCESINIVVGVKGSCWSQKNYKEIQKQVSGEIIYNQNNDVTHSSFSLFLGLNKLLPDDMIIADGDIYFRKSLIDKLNGLNQSTLVCKRMQGRDIPGTKLILKEGLITEIYSEKKDKKEEGVIVYMGVMFLKKSDAIKFRRILSEKDLYDKILGDAIKRSLNNIKWSIIFEEGIINLNMKKDLERMRV